METENRQADCQCDILNMLGGFYKEAALFCWWAKLDSNQRRINRRIYSAMPLPLGDLSLWWNRLELNQRRLSF